MFPPIKPPPRISIKKERTEARSDSNCEFKKLHFTLKHNKRDLRFFQPKQIVECDMFLSDHTVAHNDPRVLEAFEAMTRVRQRTGFDSTLVRDKVWASKTAKDLSAGLANLDRIDSHRKLFDSEYKRKINAERSSMQQRMDRARSLPSLSRKQRSKSPSATGPLAREQSRLRQCFSNLDAYVSSLESQGGFLNCELQEKADCPFEDQVTPECSSDQKGDDDGITFQCSPEAGNVIEMHRKRFVRRHSIHTSINLTLPTRKTSFKVRHSSDNEFPTLHEETMEDLF